jgi:FkbM family methyltransferase
MVNTAGLETLAPQVSADGITVVIKGLARDPITVHHEKSSTFYELEPLRRLSGLLEKQMLAEPLAWMIDAGANIGNHSLYLGSMHRKMGVLAFEMNPLTYSFLSENIQASGLMNVTCVNSGLSDRIGRCGIKQNQENPLGGAQLNVGDSGGEVDLVTIDQFLVKAPSSGRCILMKIDVEGHEVQVLKGALQTISQHRPLIYAELKEVREFKVVTDMLRALGYVVAYAEEGALPNFLFAHANDFSRLFSHEEVLAELESLSLRVVEAWQLHRKVRQLTATLNSQPAAG